MSKNELRDIIFDEKPKSTSIRTWVFISLFISFCLLKLFHIDLMPYFPDLNYLFGFLAFYFLVSLSMDKDRLLMEKYYSEKRSELNKEESNMHKKWYLDKQAECDFLKSQLPS